jgi:hypothetical protein
VAVVAALALLAAPTGAFGANTFVDKDAGSDANTCLLATAPCQTIGGVAGGLAKAGAGNTVFIDPAATPYAENLTLNTGKSLVGSDFGTIEGGQAIINGGGATAINVTTSAAGTIQGLKIRGAFGVALNQPATVTGNTFDETADNARMVSANSPAGSSQISGNTFTGGTGPTIDQAAVLDDGAPLQISGNQFSGVSVPIEATSDGADATISGNTISNVHPGTFAGIGIYVTSDPNPTIVGNLINGSGSGSGIEGIFVSEGGTAAQTGATLRRNRILGNFADGFRADETLAPVSLNSDLIAGNINTGVGANDFSAFGAGQGDVTLTNVTLAGNGTDIRLQDTLGTLDSSIVEDPISTSLGGATATCSISFSRGPTTTPGGNGCLNFQTSASPNFAGASDYHLLPTASNLANLIDHANPSAPANPLDLDGNLRAIDADGACPLNQVRDMGAYELQVSQPNCTPPTVPTTPSSPQPAVAGPTGQRAAALKKCKKKHGQARRKCKKKANLLPV